MDIWLKQKGSIRSIFVIIIIKGLWCIGNGKFALLKWIFPLLSIDNCFDNAFGVKNLSWMVFVKSMSKTYRIGINKD